MYRVMGTLHISQAILFRQPGRPQGEGKERCNQSVPYQKCTFHCNMIAVQQRQRDRALAACGDMFQFAGDVRLVDDFAASGVDKVQQVERGLRTGSSS
jgi:hypothetical protein